MFVCMTYYDRKNQKLLKKMIENYQTNWFFAALHCTDRSDQNYGFEKVHKCVSYCSCSINFSADGIQRVTRSNEIWVQRAKWNPQLLLRNSPHSSNFVWFCRNYWQLWTEELDKSGWFHSISWAQRSRWWGGGRVRWSPPAARHRGCPGNSPRPGRVCLPGPAGLQATSPARNLSQSRAFIPNLFWKQYWGTKF